MESKYICCGIADARCSRHAHHRAQLRQHLLHGAARRVGAAAAVSVGHAVGAGDPARARRAGWLALALGTGFMLVAAVVFLVAPRPLIKLYTHDPRVLAVGPSLLWIAAAFQIFDGIQTVSTGALRGLGETRVPMFANLVGYWVMGLPLGFILCFVLKWGIYGMWIGLTLALIVIASTLLSALARRLIARLALKQSKIGLKSPRTASGERPHARLDRDFRTVNCRCRTKVLMVALACLEAVRATSKVTIITSERSVDAFHRVLAGKPYSDAQVRCHSRPKGCNDFGRPMNMKLGPERAEIYLKGIPPNGDWRPGPGSRTGRALSAHQAHR